MSQRPTAHETAVVAAATSAALMIRFMRPPRYFLVSLSVVDGEDELLLEPEVEPGDDMDDELLGDEELLLAALELVSGMVELVDGVLLLDVDGDMLLPVVDDDDEDAGGVTVTVLLAGGLSALLQAASDSADSKASASIEGRFIRGSWSR